VAKIHDFYKKLVFNVESLLTLKKLNEPDTAARFTFDKLEVIKNELAQLDLQGVSGNIREMDKVVVNRMHFSTERKECICHVGVYIVQAQNTEP